MHNALYPLLGCSALFFLRKYFKMARVKLSEYCKNNGISYITGYRWFKEGRLPVSSFQADSGTIIVEDDTMENVVSSTNQSNDSMALFIKKTVEFSKSNSSIEDFAAYLLSNFQLKLNSNTNSNIENPKYSKNKPKSEDIQKHFQQFLKPKGEKPKPNMLIASPEEFDKLADESDSVVHRSLSEISVIQKYVPTVGAQDLLKNLAVAFSEEDISSDSNGTGPDSMINRVDSTPQSTNYTNSTFINHTVNDLLSLSAAESSDRLSASIIPSDIIASAGTTSTFKPTQKEIDSVTKAMEKVANELYTQAVSSRRRGRKPTKKNV
jgi:F0F1-type ATP synthase delta subunit